jgi:3'-phosphoadenosine 5'-phosphosulfate sulfotransferase (PAPS reductase)/FAD synthetase
MRRASGSTVRLAQVRQNQRDEKRTMKSHVMSQLAALEAESIHIFREVAAEMERPCLLFSGGKDSIVMLHVARKAFAPALGTRRN